MTTMCIAVGARQACLLRIRERVNDSAKSLQDFIRESLEDVILTATGSECDESFFHFFFSQIADQVRHLSAEQIRLEKEVLFVFFEDYLEKHAQLENDQNVFFLQLVSLYFSHLVKGRELMQKVFSFYYHHQKN
jgi:hypothetical protein